MVDRGNLRPPMPCHLLGRSHLLTRCARRPAKLNHLHLNTLEVAGASFSVNRTPQILKPYGYAWQLPFSAGRGGGCAKVSAARGARGAPVAGGKNAPLFNLILKGDHLRRRAFAFKHRSRLMRLSDMRLPRRAAHYAATLL